MSFITNLFGKKTEPVQKLNFSTVKTDMHSHLIPGIDDGSKSLEESLLCIRGLMEMGYSKLITTPHIMAEGYQNSPETILPGLAKLKQYLSDQKINIDLEAAGEYYLDENFIARLGNEQMLTFGDNYLLFEISLVFRPGNIPEAIFAINSHGFKPILAHVERYPYLHSRDLRWIREVKEMGTFLQMNITSLIGVYGGTARNIAQRLVDEEMIEFIGTDLHNEGHLAHLSKALGDPYVQKILSSDRLMNSTL